MISHSFMISAISAIFVKQISAFGYPVTINYHWSYSNDANVQNNHDCNYEVFYLKQL